MLAGGDEIPDCPFVNPSFLHPRRMFLRFVAGAVLCAGPDSLVAADSGKSAEQRLLYVAVPGIRNYLERGGHGVLVFDINRGHSFVRRIPAQGLNAAGASVIRNSRPRMGGSI